MCSSALTASWSLLSRANILIDTAAPKSQIWLDPTKGGARGRSPPARGTDDTPRCRPMDARWAFLSDRLEDGKPRSSALIAMVARRASSPTLMACRATWRGRPMGRDMDVLMPDPPSDNEHSAHRRRCESRLRSTTDAARLDRWMWSRATRQTTPAVTRRSGV